MDEIPIDLIEKYQNPILKFLCERQNYKIKSKSKDIAIGIGTEVIEPILREINEGPCKEAPISKEIFYNLLNNFFKNALITTYKGKKGNCIMSRKAYETVKVGLLELPKPTRKKVMEIRGNIECIKCHITDGYAPKETKCRWCGATLRRD